MSKQQLAMGGLIVGMAVEPELQRFGGLAQQALGLLFLKFGRDDENQADELGLRYMTRVDYDPREMLEVFGVLDGVTRAVGAILNQQFIVDPRVKGNITLYSEQAMSPREVPTPATAPPRVRIAVTAVFSRIVTPP